MDEPLPRVGPKYADLCEDAVRRIYARELARRKGPKEAQKATRAALHQISGAFLNQGELRRARALLAAHRAGAPTAIGELMALHASTRERLPDLDRFYDEIFTRIGTPSSILDLACGLNPIYLGSRGQTVFGLDVHGGAVRLVNEAAALCGFPIRAALADLVGMRAFPAAELTLVMKLLPLLEAQRKGACAQLLAALPPGHLVVTFPTRSLGGRDVGMRANYARWFEDLLATESAVRLFERFVVGSELIYLLHKER